MLILRRLLDLVLPRYCAACDAPVVLDAPLCAACAGSLVPGAGASCPGCGLVYLTPPAGGATHRCGECLRTPPPFARAHAAYAYGAALADAVARWKNAPDHTLGPALGRLLVGAARDSGWTPPASAVVVPVPSHRRSLRRRHFNPAGVLARDFALAYALPLDPTALVLERPIAPSKGLDRRARLRRAQGAFAPARPHALAGRSVVLVDDVMTTGATVRAASSACLRGGARDVEVWVLGRAPRG